MLFRKVWIISNLVYVETYHIQKSLSGPWPWLHKIIFPYPNWHPGAHYPKARFFIAPSPSNLTHTFFPWLGQPEPLWVKSSEIIQIWLKPFPLTGTFPWLEQLKPFWAKKTQTSPNLIKTLSFDRNITWTISDPKEPVKTVHVVATYQVSIPYNQGS